MKKRKGRLVYFFFCCLAFLLSVILPAVLALKSESLHLVGAIDTTYTNADFIACSTNDPPGTIDPGWDKDVGVSQVFLNDGDGDGRYEQILLFINNSYPYYHISLNAFIHNGGNIPEVIRSVEVTCPPEITLNYSNLLGKVILPGEIFNAVFSLQVEQEAKENTQYLLTIEMTVDAPFYGTIGYWKNWKHHKIYTRTQIEQWLQNVDESSLWLGPTTVAGMEEMLRINNSSSMRDKFLAHYLATRLNMASSNFYPQSTHDVRALDPSNYLNLSHPEEATLEEIIQAIESKYFLFPNHAEYEVMKNICDALNNLRI